MRLTSSFWVSAYLRRCSLQTIFGVVEKKGEASAGAIFIKVSLLDGTSLLFTPAPQSAFSERAAERKWVAANNGAAMPDDDITAHMARERKFDPDFWLVTIEDREGRHLLEDELVLDNP